jgi:hypothetical protein
MSAMAHHISNPNRDNYWTCPACYHDLADVGIGKHECPQCKAEIDCTIEHEPSCHSRLVESETE